MLYVFNTLAPIGLLILSGLLLRRFGFAPPVFFSGLNRLVYWVALPALLLDKTSRPLESGDVALRIFGLLTAVTLACVVLGYLAARVLRLPLKSMGVFIQGSFRGNLAYIGLPVVLFSLESMPAEIAQPVATAAVLALAPLIPIYNILAVLVLVSAQSRGERTRPPHVMALHVVRNVLTNPLLLSCVAGLLLAYSGIGMPVFVRRGLTATGRMALPLSLIAIGACLTADNLDRHVARALTAASVKVLLAPLLGLLLGPWFGLQDLPLRAALIFLACPTAVASFVMAEQLGGDAELAGHIVLLTTVLSLPGLALVLLLT